MKKLLLSCCIILVSGIISAQGFSNLANQLTPPLFGASPFQDSLWAFDTTNFNVIYRCGPMPSSGGSITGINSVSVHPCTGEIYIVFKQSAVSGRVLGKFDPATCVATIIGNLGDNFSSITFLKSGQLIGVTGDGATVPETVYHISTVDASTTLLRTLGNGADGEVIAYNKDDNMVYHWSGNGTIVFEKFDTSGITVTGIPIIGTTNGETFGAVYLGGNMMLLSDISSRFQKINVNGTWGPLLGSTSPDDIRGLAMINRWLVQNGNDTICANDSSLLTAMGGQAYQWTLNGAPISGATSSTYYATQSGWYNCQITTDVTNCIAGTGDTAMFGKRLVVHPLPVVNITPASPAYLCNIGDSILLTGSSGGTSQWYMNGAIIAGATTNTHYVNDLGVYNMTKTNTNGCIDSAAIGTTVIYAPVNTITSGADACIGDSIKLNSEFGASSYGWLFNGSLLTTTTEDSIYVTNTGNYSVITFYGSCIDTSNIVTSTIHSLPVVTINPSPLIYICNAGDSILLTGSSGGTSQWYLNGSSISGATSNTYYATTAGFYNITKTNSNGCTDSAATSTEVQIAPVFVLSPGGSSILCTGGSVPLSVTSGADSYSWLLNGSPISGANTNTYNATATGVYNCLITIGNCTDTTSISHTLTIIDCSGIQENNSVTINLYPNPAHEKLNITSSNNILIEQIDVVDLSGRKVMSLTPNSSNIVLNVEELRDGAYMITITTASGVKTRKFIKN